MSAPLQRRSYYAKGKAPPAARLALVDRGPRARGRSCALAHRFELKRVVNDDGGTRTAGDFSIHVKSGGVDVAGSPQPGSVAGSDYTLAAGDYEVSEDEIAGYAMSLQGDCDAQGKVSLQLGESKTCTITNDDVAPPPAPELRVVKRVVNDDGGTKTTGDFSVHVKAGGVDVPGSPQPGSAAGTSYTLEPVRTW